jgi:Protein of unknown function (DUF4239)
MNILLAAAILLGAVAIACLLMLAIRRLGTRDVFLADTTRGAGVYGVAGTGFAVLLAFVVLVAFEQFNDAKDGAQAESDAVIELFRDAAFFDRADRTRMQADLVCYARAIVEQEWPAMREGNGDPLPVVERWVVDLQAVYQRLPVRTPREEAVFASILELRTARIDARRERLSQAEPTVTSPVWFILIVGALVSIGFVLLFIDRRGEAFLAQAALISTVTVIVVAGLLLVWFLDHPYEDQAGSIKPEEMRRAIEVMEAEQPGLNLPCTPVGEAQRA